ncbi:hypothetical protein PFISCL1PPCAC_9224, partial [Pristionchus fissidentatus]
RRLPFLSFLCHNSLSLFLLKNPFGLNEFKFVLKLLSSLLPVFSNFTHFLYECLLFFNLFLNFQVHHFLFLSVNTRCMQIPHLALNFP